MRRANSLLWLLLAVSLPAQQGRWASVEGRIEEQRGDELLPLAGCLVAAHSPANRGALAGAVSDNQGRFRFGFPPAPGVATRADCPGYRQIAVNGRSHRMLLLDCSQTGVCAEVVLTMEALAEVEGFLVDDRGQPIENGGVTLEPAAAGQRRRGRSQRSDDRGYFRFYNLPAGDYTLRPEPSQPFHVGPTWQGDPVPLSLEPGDRISGLRVEMRLVDSVDFSGRIEGLPPGTKQIQVSVESSIDERSRNSMSMTLPVDEHGRFNLEGLRAGKVNVRVTSAPSSGEEAPAEPFHYMAKVDLTAGAGERVLRRFEPGALRGRVEVHAPEQDELRRFVRTETVVFQLQSEDGLYISGMATTPDYTFEINDIAPGHYTLVEPGAAPLGPTIEQRTADGNWIPLDTVEVRDGETRTLDLRFRYEFGRLTVVVKPAPGSPEAEQGLPAGYYSLGIRSKEFTRLMPTDQNGVLSIPIFPGGEYEICAWRDVRPEEIEKDAVWERAGEAVRRFRHENGADMEITLTAAQ